jgi:hypothetical protein
MSKCLYVLTDLKLSIQLLRLRNIEFWLTQHILIPHFILKATKKNLLQLVLKQLHLAIV